MGLLGKKKDAVKQPQELQLGAASEGANKPGDAEAAPLPVASAASAPAGLLGASTSQLDSLTPEQRRTLAHVQALSKVMDSAITIPVIGYKFGLDGLIGLVPYAGDMVGGTVGTYIISRALKYNMPKRLVLRMLINQGIDSVVGIVPFVGDIFDFGFKANSRNMRLLAEHLEHPKQATRADTCFLVGMFLLVVVLPVVLVLGVIAAIVVGIMAGLGALTH